MARNRAVLAAAVAAGLVACGGGDARPAAPPLAEKAFYRVDAGAAKPCARGAACEAQLVLTALGNYHVNQDYPFKFVADPRATPVDGTGTFGFDGAKQLTMKVVFRPAEAGTARLVGTFKLSVCSDENCEIESPTLELAVPVT